MDIFEILILITCTVGLFAFTREFDKPVCPKSNTGTCKRYQVKKGIKYCIPYECKIIKMNFKCKE